MKIAISKRAITMALLGLICLAAPMFAQAQSGQPTLKTITVDGDLSDWQEILVNPTQVSHDGDGSSFADCGDSLDRDCLVGGGAGSDLLSFAWTYDATHIYLYVERFGSTAAGLAFYFIMDLNGNDVAEASDAVLEIRWSGSNRRTDRVLHAYDPLLPCPVLPECNDLVDTSGFADGHSLQGAVGAVIYDYVAQDPVQFGGSPDGLAFETALRWEDLDVDGDGSPDIPWGAPIHWHVAAANGNGMANVVDNMGDPAGSVGVFGYGGVSISPAWTRSTASPASVLLPHRVENVGNLEGQFDLMGSSSLGLSLTWWSDPDGDGDPADGEIMAVDGNGDGDFSDVGDTAPSLTWDTDSDDMLDFVLIWDPNQNDGFDFVLQVDVPSGLEAVTDQLDLDVAFHANPAIFDDTTDVLYIGFLTIHPERSGAGMPGQYVRYSHLVTNNGAAIDTAELSAVSDQAWFIDLYSDPDGDGDPADGILLAQDLDGDGVWDAVGIGADTNGDGSPDTGPLAAVGGQTAIVLELFIPGAAAIGIMDTTGVTVTSSLAASRVASVRDRTEVLDRVTLEPDYLIADGTMLYAAANAPTETYTYFPFLLTNAWTDADDFDLSAVSSQGWTVTLWSDPNGNGSIEDGQPITQTPLLSPMGGRYRLIAQVSVPDGMPPLTIDTTTVTAESRTTPGILDTAIGELVTHFVQTFLDELFQVQATLFATCETAYVAISGLSAGEVGRYELRYVDPSATPAGSEVINTDARGSADTSLTMDAIDPLGTWTIELWDLTAGPAQLDSITIEHERAGSVLNLVVSPDPALPGDDLRVVAELSNDNLRAGYGPSLLYTRVITPSAADLLTRQDDVDPLGHGDRVDLNLGFPAVAFPETGTYTVELRWETRCGAIIVTATTSFEVDVDTDGDGLSDTEEGLLGTDPNDADSDDDGLSDGEEVEPGADGYITDPNNPDTDGDGVWDGTEVGETTGVADPDGAGPLEGTDMGVFVPDQDDATTTDPTQPDTDGDGLNDGAEDVDGNGQVDPGEPDPNNPDTDGDGVLDGADNCPLHANPSQDLNTDPDNCGSCGNICADADWCNGDEICAAGVCAAGPPVDCDDGVTCTIDACDEVNDLCINTANDAACDDGDDCTLDSCDLLNDCQNVFTDSDGDGTCDADDPCPLDPNDLCTGCPDADADGICDIFDICPNDPTDQCTGCPDADGDGACDVVDPCPNDPTDQCTACTDDDADGICDDVDPCPGNAANDCAVCADPSDPDNDGLQTCVDPCPNDPLNLCVPCNDADGDGVCDPFDICPNDPTDQCMGCPDADGDGSCDVIDPCPNDATDQCAACTDTDADGICDDVDPCPGNAINDCGACQDQTDPDGDGLPNCVDPCPLDPDNACVPCTDTDGDGICDAFDICPDDPTNACVGCTDLDSDGICDVDDPCPGDPENTCGGCTDLDGDLLCDEVDPCPGDPLNECGACQDQSDPDGDGLPTCVDPCPNDPDNLCVPCDDSDGDGVCDPFDICPDDPADACQACTDSDGDGICDVSDSCPDDPTNTCSACTDTDADGLCDTFDPCPDDPTNACGVCADQSDPDGDGVPTCVDPCPDDPYDSCVPCDDADGDGICDTQDVCPDDPDNACSGCADNDGDGVCNAIDPCPDDPADGCIPCMDMDQDGLCDPEDPCPADPDNHCGACIDQSDPDGDGQPTCVDPCPDDPHNACVPCEDRDADGICDAFDPCPQDPNNSCTECSDQDRDEICDAVDPCPDDPDPDCSCSDSDQDGLCDDVDPCPHDATNLCNGCVDQSDPDGDGTPTCVDPCPSDPHNACVGCEDADLDGACDPVDPCPDDPADLCDDTQIAGGGCACGTSAGSTPFGLLVGLFLLVAAIRRRKGQ